MSCLILAETAKREVQEETGIQAGKHYLWFEVCKDVLKQMYSIPFILPYKLIIKYAW